MSDDEIAGNLNAGYHFVSEQFHKDLMKNLKIFYRIYFAGVFLLITFSSLFAEEKKIPLDASERKLLEQSRIEVPSHYIEAHDFEGEMACLLYTSPSPRD